MIQAAWTWASNTNNLRRSCVHGEEEARLVLTDAFEANDVTSHETSYNRAIDVQDENGTLLDTDVPHVDANASVITSGVGSAAAASSVAQAEQSFNDVLLKLFAETTKQDLILNNYVVRARLHS
ncbi:unnamed protein product [Symbiodinium sp. CCMP2456]|nr:unnamed protein product [Symbiodinium sp. CCMP2456]